jgi:hypothetical protein
MAVLIYLPNNSLQEPLFSTFLPILIFCLLYKSFLLCKVTTHYGFNFYFSGDYWFLSIFLIPIGHLYVFFWEMPIQVFFHFLIRLFGFLAIELSSLYILDINPLFNVWFEKLFLISFHLLLIDCFLGYAEIF